MKRTTNGFTLVEIIVVVAIFALIIAFASIIDLSAFKRDLFHAEQSTIVSVLERARNRSMANMFESAHGVCYDSGRYVIFYDTDCDGTGTDEVISANMTIASASNFDTDFPTIIFSQLAGTTTGTNILITDGLKSATTTINYEGTINW